VRDEGGLSLIEVLVALLLIAGALVPLMQLSPGMLRQNQQDETTMVLSAVALRQMEATLASLRANIGSVTSGTAACSDLPSCLAQWSVATEASSAAPGVGQLVDVAVTACLDLNGDGTCDAGEPQVRYDAKVTSRP
jgi:type II secretory pathway pseudopilin PulG